MLQSTDRVVLPPIHSSSAEPIRSSSGFHIIKLVDKRKSDEQHLVIQTRARHILIRPTELQSSDDARRKLEQLKQRIAAGDDFADMARSHSEESATAVNGGSVGWVSPGGSTWPKAARADVLVNG